MYACICSVLAQDDLSAASTICKGAPLENEGFKGGGLKLIENNRKIKVSGGSGGGGSPPRDDTLFLGHAHSR